MGAVRIAGDLGTDVPGVPIGLQIGFAANQVVEVARLVVDLQPRLDRRAGVAAGVDRERDDLGAPRRRAQLGERLLQLGADQRADVGTVGIEEGDGVGTAGQPRRVISLTAGGVLELHRWRRGHLPAGVGGRVFEAGGARG